MFNVMRLKKESGLGGEEGNNDNFSSYYLHNGKKRFALYSTKSFLRCNGNFMVLYNNL